MKKSLAANCKTITMWTFPLLMLLIQLLPIMYTALFATLLFLLAIAFREIREIKSVFLLFSFTAYGYAIWSLFSNLISNSVSNNYYATILGRLGLLGYLALFFLWHLRSKPQNSYIHLGKSDEDIYFPLFWKGKKESIWRFVLIFCIVCMIPIIIAISNGLASLEILKYGLIFTLVNAVLEELLWRGFILSRSADSVGEVQGLIITALTFGIYHLSLGFPVWTCLVFAVGGYFMGGTAIRSKGLIAPLIMHIFVNMIFVTYGLIF